jgi:hypothetical protein
MVACQEVEHSRVELRAPHCGACHAGASVPRGYGLLSPLRVKQNIQL